MEVAVPCRQPSFSVPWRLFRVVKTNLKKMGIFTPLLVAVPGLFSCLLHQAPHGAEGPLAVQPVPALAVG